MCRKLSTYRSPYEFYYSLITDRSNPTFTYSMLINEAMEKIDINGRSIDKRMLSSVLEDLLGSQRIVCSGSEYILLNAKQYLTLN